MCKGILCNLDFFLISHCRLLLGKAGSKKDCCCFRRFLFSESIQENIWLKSFLCIAETLLPFSITKNYLGYSCDVALFFSAKYTQNSNTQHSWLWPKHSSHMMDCLVNDTGACLRWPGCWLCHIDAVGLVFVKCFSVVPVFLDPRRQSKAARGTARQQKSSEQGTDRPSELQNEVGQMLGVNLTLIESDYLHFVVVMY